VIQRHAALLARIERQFGVPATLLMAIWTLESDNGTGDMGKLPVIRTLATLAQDCYRSELFQGEFLAALQIVQRGASAGRGIVAALLWFAACLIRIPPMTYADSNKIVPALRKQSRVAAVAAAFAGLAVLFQTSLIYAPYVHQSWLVL